MGKDNNIVEFVDFIEEVADPAMGETAWSEDAMFQVGRVKYKYNPDSLIGRKGFSVYRKMMLDEQVKAVVKFKRDAITSRQYYFEVDEEKLGKAEAERRLSVCDEIMEQISGKPIDVFNGIMTATWQGVSYSEKNFKHIEVDGKTFIGLKSVKLKPFDTFTFDVDEYGNVKKFLQEISGKEHELDLFKFIHHVQNPEYDEHYGQSELREAYRAWFSKDMAIKFYNMWLERSASGYKWINTSARKGTPEHTALQSVLANSVNGTGMMFGKDDVFNIAFPAGNGEAFSKAIDKHDLGIARALLVPNLMGITPAGQTGSFSQSDTQLNAFLWTLDQEAGRLEETLNDQVFKELGLLNFGDNDYPRIRFQPISEKRKIEVITLWKDLVGASAVTHSETDESHIRQMLDFPEKEEGDPNNEDPNKDPNETDSSSNDDDSNNGGDASGSNSDNDSTDEGVDESIQAKGLARLYRAKFTAAQKRVDFAVIKDNTEALERSEAQPITNMLYSMTKEAIESAKELLNEDGTLPTKALDVTFNSKSKQSFRKVIDSTIREFWKTGQKHAEIEIDKSKGAAFSLKIDRERIDFVSQEFFKVKSFKVAGKLTDDAQSIISQVISNGMKGGKTFAQIETDIYLSMGSNGFMSLEDYREALGAALDPNMTNPQARIDTMLRTNGFEAVNEARYSYFTDPALDGFVEALEYSPILDGRTTQICQHLDGHVHAVDSDVWQEYKPPNHYGCRSLLMAVTENDSWSESEYPEIEPQRGFK